MPRTPRINTGNTIYHTLNRINGRMVVFNEYADYALFEQILAETNTRFGMRLLAYCIMPNHWHLLLHPRNDGDLSTFMKHLTAMHTQRHHVMRRTIGNGHIYQGRYKSSVVDTNEYLVQACRYIERNPVRAGLVTRAEEWPWSSIRERLGMESTRKMLNELPTDLGSGYLTWVNEAESEKDLTMLRAKVREEKKQGRPRKGA